MEDPAMSAPYQETGDPLMTAVLISAEDEVQNIRFVRFPTKPTAIAKVVRVENEIVALLKNGRVACSRDLGRWAYPPSASKFWRDPITEALVRLGVISREARDRHLAECERARERDRLRHAKKDLEQGAAALGIPLTKRQMSKIASL